MSETRTDRRRRPLPPHGTDARHSRGCRCQRCISAHSAYVREWRDRRRGGPSGYRYWTADECLEALRAWAAEHGRVPSWGEWRLASPDRPGPDTIRRHFGTWSNALVAAGFEARPPGDNLDPARREARDRETAVLAARREAGETLAAMAAEVGVTPQVLGRRIQRWVWGS